MRRAAILSLVLVMACNGDDPPPDAAVADTTGEGTTSTTGDVTGDTGDTTGDTTTTDGTAPLFECTPAQDAIIEPLWMAGGPGTRADLGKFGKPDALFIDDNDVLLAGDEDDAFEELHLYDLKSDDPTKRADWLTPIADIGADPGPSGTGKLEFRGISGFAKDPKSGRIYVVEQKNGRVQLLTPTDKAPFYEHHSFFGAFAADKNAPEDGEFVRLQAARTDSLGRLFLSDDARDNVSSSRRDIQIFTPELEYETKFGDHSYGDLGVDGNLAEPENFVIDEGRDRIYVCDENTADVAVYKYSDLSFVQRFGGFIDTPNGIDVDDHGFLYVVDQGKSEEGAFVRVFDPESLTEVFRFGNYSEKGDPKPGHFRSPDTLIIDKQRDLLVVADQGHDRIQGFSLSEVQGLACVVQLRAAGATRAVAGKRALFRVEILQRDSDWERRGWRKTGRVTATRDGAAMTLDQDTFKLHNGQGSVALTLPEAGSVELRFTVGGLTTTATVEVLDAPPQRDMSGILSGEELTWRRDDGVIHVSGVVTVPAEETLTIEPGTLIMLEPEARVETEGGFRAKGTEDEPILFFGADDDAGWGWVEHKSLNAKVEYENVLLTGAGNTGFPRDGLTIRHCCNPVLRVHGGDADFRRIMVAHSAGKGLYVVRANLSVKKSYFGHLEMGGEIDTPNATIEDTWFVESRGVDDNDGLYIWGFMAFGLKEQQPQDHWEGKSVDDESIVLRRSIVADGDDDGIDTRGAAVLIDQCLVYGMADKGISLTAGRPRIERTLVKDNKIGMKVDYWTLNAEWFDVHPAPHTFGPHLKQVTIARSVEHGLQISDRGGGDHETADIQPTLDQVIIWDAAKSIHTDWTPDLITMNSSVTQHAIATSGGNNSTTPPTFVDEPAGDYRQNPHSQALTLGAGWPGF